MSLSQNVGQEEKETDDTFNLVRAVSLLTSSNPWGELAAPATMFLQLTLPSMGEEGKEKECTWNNRRMSELRNVFSGSTACLPGLKAFEDAFSTFSVVGNKVHPDWGAKVAACSVKFLSSVESRYESDTVAHVENCLRNLLGLVTFLIT